MPQRLSEVPLDRLVPETQEWNGGGGIDLLSWVACVGSIEYAVAYGELFWPEFVEFDGCILRAGFAEDNYHAWLAQTGGNKQAVELVMNHRHVLDVFTPDHPGPSREQVVDLGRLLREVWTAKSQRDFPERRIVVRFREEDCKDLLDYEISVCQDRG